MSHQALNKDIDNIFKQFDRTAELIIKLISVLLDRNNKSLNIANIINNNMNDEITITDLPLIFQLKLKFNKTWKKY